jgi:hypothetical protein
MLLRLLTMKLILLQPKNLVLRRSRLLLNSMLTLRPMLKSHRVTRLHTQPVLRNQRKTILNTNQLKFTQHQPKSTIKRHMKNPRQTSRLNPSKLRLNQTITHTSTRTSIKQMFIASTRLLLMLVMNSIFHLRLQKRNWILTTKNQPSTQK